MCQIPEVKFVVKPLSFNCSSVQIDVCCYTFIGVSFAIILIWKKELNKIRHKNEVYEKFVMFCMKFRERPHWNVYEIKMHLKTSTKGIFVTLVSLFAFQIFIKWTLCASNYNKIRKNELHKAMQISKWDNLILFACKIVFLWNLHKMQ